MADTSLSGLRVKRELDAIAARRGYAKRLERGRFVWPTVRDGAVSMTPAQLSMLLEGMDWRTPVRSWQPEMAG